jgi:hypothetical protein
VSHRTASACDDGDPRFALLAATLAERLRPVCAGWEDARFQVLVRQIARLKLQWGDAERGVVTGVGRAD